MFGKWLGFSKSTTGALTLVGGLGNTSFIGVPMIEALQGKAGIPMALVMDQAGSYMVLSTLGMLAVSIYCSAASSFAGIAKRIITFPPFIALCLAIVLIDADYPSWLEVTLKRLGDMLAPLALLSVGMQMRMGELSVNKTPLAIGLGYKLLACPIIILACHYFSGMRIESLSANVIVFEAAMGPSIGAGIVASQHNLNPALVTLMVGIGVPLCLLTVPLLSSGLRLAGV